VVSGNVSLYNETPDGPILPTPVVGTIGLIEHRGDGPRLGWDPGDELWLLGEPADDAAMLAGSELAWRRGRRGGLPALAVEPVARLVALLARLPGVVIAVHDASTGGLGTALARMAIAAGCGAAVRLESARPTALLHGERAGRVVAALSADRVPSLVAALEAHRVTGTRIGTAGGSALAIRVGADDVAIGLDELAAAWRTAF
jgi:phosphoribosylformylglycinamidine synthase